MAKKQHVQAKKRDAKQRRAHIDELKRRQRAGERRRTALTIVSALVIGLMLVGFVAYSRWAPKRVGHVAGASAAAKKAGCTGVRNDPAGSRAHKTPAVKYDASPPSSGDHNADPLPEQPQFFGRDVKAPLLTERAVHNLEHGFVVGWYDSALPQLQVDKLKAASATATRFLAVPWTRGTFSGGRHFVLTSWQRSQRCETVSPDVIAQYTDKFVNSPLAPEVGGTGGSPLTSPTSAVTPSSRPKPSPSSTK